MSKFKKKKDGGLPAINTASLPDIVFMLLFFFMVATVMRDDTLMVDNILPAASEVEKLVKDRTTFIYAGRPHKKYNVGKEARIQINDKFVSLDEIGPSVTEYINKLRPDLQSRVVVAVKADKSTNAGVISDIK
jgi:biopolymer transport protein ExbD